MPTLRPRAWIESATPLMPEGNVLGLGTISPVIFERPDLTDQQSSTKNC